MRTIDRIIDAAEREVVLIENDGMMDEAEKRRAIRDVYDELREIIREYETDDRIGY
jgi:hypothetical protein